MIQTNALVAALARINPARTLPVNASNKYAPPAPPSAEKSPPAGTNQAKQAHPLPENTVTKKAV